MEDIKPTATNPAHSDIIGETEVKFTLSDHELELENALENYDPNTDAERRLVRKLDTFMMPTLWIMYILAYIDRQNIVSTRIRCCSPSGLSSDNEFVGKR